MEILAVKEAIKLKIPIVAVVDTNSDPTGINFPIPGNDDARRSINLYCDLVKQTIIDAQKQTKDSESLELKDKEAGDNKKVDIPKKSEKSPQKKQIIKKINK